MLVLQDEPQYFQVLSEKRKSLCGDLVSSIAASVEGFKVPASDDIFRLEECRGKLLLIQEGSFQYHRDGRLLFLMDEGDLIGFEHAYNYLHPGTMVADFAGTKLPI